MVNITHLTPILYMKDLGHRARTSSVLSKATLQGKARGKVWDPEI